MDACNKKCAVKVVPNDYMVGVKRVFETDSNGVEHGKLLMPSHIDGIEALCSDHLVSESWMDHWEGSNCAVSKGTADATRSGRKGYSRRGKPVQERGFNTIKGLTMTLWAARCAYPECKYRNSQLSKVASWPTEAAWDHMMHMVAWVIEHNHRGVRFNADRNRIPMAYVDASNKQDPKSCKCQNGFDIRIAGGPFIT